MTRDMELVRLLLLQQEQGKAPPELAKYGAQEVCYNVALMADAGLVHASFAPDATNPEFAQISRLTWAGHDFLDATRNSAIWKAAKDHILKTGVSWTFQTLMEYLRRELLLQWPGGFPPAP